MILFLALAAALGAVHEPCTTSTPSCTEWISLDGRSRSLVYRTFPLDATNEKVTRALIVIHGRERRADLTFRTAVAAAFLAGALKDTLVVAPHFASNDGGYCDDALEPNEVNWLCSDESWRNGASAVTNGRLDSFDLTDELVRKVARRSTFPNLKSIVVAGHSAGGQYVARYALTTGVYDGLGVPVTYVVSNSSSYTYLDAVRPLPGSTQFGPFADAGNCTAFDRWPYGLQNRKGDAARLSAAELKRNLVTRPVVYLLGELDTAPVEGFDSTCPAMAQGATRLERGENYARYVDGVLGGLHTVVVVPLCAHNERCMLTSDTALPILFPGR